MPNPKGHDIPVGYTPGSHVLPLKIGYDTIRDLFDESVHGYQIMWSMGNGFLPVRLPYQGSFRQALEPTRTHRDSRRREWPMEDYLGQQNGGL